MFTGLITHIGRVRESVARDGGRDLRIDAPWGDVVAGESIAVDGACLTVTGRGDGWFGVHVITTSLERTGFAQYETGRRVNLERALRAGDRLGGHIVQGHVDGIGTVIKVEQRLDARLIDIGIPPDVADVSIVLGSIAIDGVSLTINAIPAPDELQVSLIPFTLEHTTLAERQAGDRVHLEGDTVGKYVKGLAAARRAAEAR